MPIFVLVLFSVNIVAAIVNILTSERALIRAANVVMLLVYIACIQWVIHLI